jgi:PAS domain S-box-containing protein
MKLVHKAQEEEFEDFMFTESTETKEIVRAAERNEYVIVYYIEPLKTNKPVLGYNIASNPTRLKAIDKSFDNGTMSATDRITLVQETGEQFGILLLLPIYKQNVRLKNTEDRQKHRKGVVVEVLRIGDVIENALKDFSDEGIDMYLYDLSAEEANRFLYFRPSHISGMTKQPHKKEEIQKDLYWTRNFDVADRQWQILFSPSSFYLNSQQSLQAWIVLSVSLLLTCLLTYYLLRKLTYTAEIEQRVKKQTETNLELKKEIMERKHIEEKLRERERRLQTIIETEPECVKVLSLDGILNDMNAAGLNMIEAETLEQVAGQPIYALISPEYRDAYRKHIESVCLGNKASLAFEITGLKGTRRWLDTQTVPLRNEKNEITGLLGITRDITNQKKLEGELLKSQKLESLGILAGGIAHDFNNMLTAALSNIYLSKKCLDPGHKSYERLVTSEQVLKKAGGLTQQLLTFSKGGEPIKRLISLAEVIKDLSGFALSGSNVRCELDMAYDLWPVHADEGQINQVIHNIIVNSEQSMPEGGIVNIHAENTIVGKTRDLPLQEGSYVKIRITDKGIGISEEHMQKVFDPYFTTKQWGSGLGLAVCYSIINNHNGHISVESEKGVGTTFTIYLPASETHVTEEKPSEKRLITGEGRILIMDDDEFLRNSLVEILMEIGYEVASAKDGVEAIRKYERTIKSSRPFDAVIMDLTIPGGMGGKETIKRLSEIDPKIKVIVSSGYSDDPVMANFEEYGFSDVLSKPYNPEELSNTLHNVLKDTRE